jgi:hypothetical protein
MLFKNSVRTSKRTPHFTITKINWLMLFKEIIPLQPKRERERVRKDSIRVKEKGKHLGESERRFMSEGEKRASC